MPSFDFASLVVIPLKKGIHEFIRFVTLISVQ